MQSLALMALLVAAAAAHDATVEDLSSLGSLDCPNPDIMAENIVVDFEDTNGNSIPDALTVQDPGEITPISGFIGYKEAIPSNFNSWTIKIHAWPKILGRYDIDLGKNALLKQYTTQPFCKTIEDDICGAGACAALQSAKKVAISEFCSKPIGLPKISLPGGLEKYLSGDWKVAACIHDQNDNCRGCFGIHSNPLKLVVV